ncbi:hypothetical protein BDA96_10G204000 [Sorghum bicolor]|uniref:AN1-type domain-containing protein n=1 Tax=Sorghum bicolor TaxID=4558 RepID=A0A921U0W0_SORBI|nr:hypothetical protein BDA96_10G204000 [Sorghum bicolor]
MYPSSATATAAAGGGGGEATAAAQCSGCSAALPRAALGSAGGILMFVGTAETKDLCARCTLEYYYRTGGLGAGGRSSTSAGRHATCPFAFAAPAAPKNKNKNAVAPPMRPKSNCRCGACPKKVGLLGFACRRCGGTFCSAHRHAESHGCCSFDYTGGLLCPGGRSERIDKQGIGNRV